MTHHCPRRQPWRDRPPDHPRLPGGRPAQRRALLRPRRHAPPTSARPTTRSGSRATSTSTRWSPRPVAVGADAVHPGYGFLSERAAFARAVEEAGLTLVGPTADVMDRMGRKDAAREIAVEAGVPVVPSYDGTADPDHLRLPGAGQGRRRRRRQGHADRARRRGVRRRGRLRASARPPRAFGDDTILVEKYVEHGRHIEVQVLADHHGNVVHLFERDCSTQRRHQKVLEEAPAPTISEAVRRTVTEASVALAAHVGYRNAGTVEFLLDDDTGEAYFLEMNTRLQVEHPVTESVVLCTTPSSAPPGRPASSSTWSGCSCWSPRGEPLPFGQHDLTLSGHAIEARVYAEDPFHGFLPQAGTASIVRWPERARVDAALESGQVVSTAYDPMLGKIIVHGPDRESARRALVAALDETAILGLTTNTGFLRALVASDEFRDATIDTAWLDQQVIEEPDRELPRVFVAWIQAMLVAMQDHGHPFQADGWRDGADPAPILVELDETVAVDRARGRVGDHDVRQLGAENHVAVLIIDGKREQAVVNVQPHIVEVVHHGHRHVFERPDVFADHGPAVGDGTLVAPMPGTVLAVNVEADQRVSAGEVLGVLEAMKMELALTAPFDGTVSLVGARVGDQVALGAVLFEVTEAPEDTEATEEGDA